MKVGLCWFVRSDWLMIICCSQGTTAVWQPSLSYIAVLASTWSSPTSPPSSSSSCPGSASGWTWSTCRAGWPWASPPSSPSPASQRASAQRRHKSHTSRLQINSDQNFDIKPSKGRILVRHKWKPYFLRQFVVKQLLFVHRGVEIFSPDIFTIFRNWIYAKMRLMVFIREEDFHFKLLNRFKYSNLSG